MSTSSPSIASRASDVEFHRLLDTLPMAAYACDSAGLITYYNSPALGIWGREPKLRDPVDRYCGSFRLFALDGSPIAHRDCWMARALSEGRAYTGESIVIERSDGSRRVAIAHANPLYDEAGMLSGAVNVLIDITEHKHVEAQLRNEKQSLEAEVAQRRQLERQLQMALSAGRMGIWEWDIETNKVTWSTENELLYGFEPGTFDGRMETIIERFHPEDRQRVADEISENAEPGSYRTSSYRVVWPDGSIHWLESSGQGIADAEGRRVRQIGVTYDVSQRKQAELELRAEPALLRQLIEAHEHEQRLIAFELHDGVIQYAIAAQMHMESCVHKVADGPAQQKLAAAAALLRTTVAEGRQLMNGIRPPVLDEVGIVAAIEYLLSTVPDEPPRAIFVSVMETERFEPALEMALYRIVQEALNNARKHSQAQEVRISLQFSGNQLNLQIVDDGIGFVPTGVRTGTAEPSIHGLQGIRERVRLLSGACRIESAPGGGTRITIELPAIERPRAAFGPVP